MTLPIERFKDSYNNWRWNPFTDADYAVDKTEDGLYIPGSSPFLVQLLEVPRKNEPSTIAVWCYGVKTDVDQDSASGQKVLYVASTVGFSPGDLIIINRGGDREETKVIDTVQSGVSLTVTVSLEYTHTAVQADDVEKYTIFTEVGAAPAQSEFRVDYPPADGSGTGLIEFNNNDNSKEIKVVYKATGSPILAETLDTKVSFPAGTPNDNEILGFVSGAPDWRNNPVCYSHEGNVIYHASGEDESSLLYLFKKSANQANVFLFLQGAKLHQGYYTELKEHLHAVGTLAGSQPTHQHTVSGLTESGGAGASHTHPVGSLSVGSGGGHNHDSGTLAGTQDTHRHYIDASTDNATCAHDHGNGTLVGSQPTHSHSYYKSVQTTQPQTGSDGNDAVTISGRTGSTGSPTSHDHPLGIYTNWNGDKPVDISGVTGSEPAHGHSLSGSTGEGGEGASHQHSISLLSTAAGNDAVTISGSVANAGGSPKTYPDQLKIYLNGVDKTTQILALTVLTEFGNGTAGHDFVTTGSGEMDISSLITSDGIWTIKITEPISAKGGRALLHIEVY